jgi:hypothetical protein
MGRQLQSIEKQRKNGRRSRDIRLNRFLTIWKRAMRLALDRFPPLFPRNAPVFAHFKPHGVENGEAASEPNAEDP